MSETHQDYFNVEPILSTEFLTVPDVPTVVVSFVDLPFSEITAAFDSTFQAMFPALGPVGITPTSAPFSLYHRNPTETLTFDIGIPVDKPLAQEITTADGHVIKPSTIPAGQIARVSYIGPYDGLSSAWSSFLESVNSSGRKPAFPFWEVYLSDPTPTTDPTTLRTDLYTALETI